jgi:hypothetical protein
MKIYALMLLMGAILVAGRLFEQRMLASEKASQSGDTTDRVVA